MITTIIIVICLSGLLLLIIYKSNSSVVDFDTKNTEEGMTMTIKPNYLGIARAIIFSSPTTDKVEEPSLTDIAGFYGVVKHSPDNSYSIVYESGHYEQKEWVQGVIAVIHQGQLQYKKQFNRVLNCEVSNTGIVVIYNDVSVGKAFLCLNQQGKPLFIKKLKVNISNLFISPNGTIAVFKTHGSRHNDLNADTLFIIDTYSSKLIKSVKVRYYFDEITLDSNNDIVLMYKNESTGIVHINSNGV